MNNECSSQGYDMANVIQIARENRNLALLCMKVAMELFHAYVDKRAIVAPTGYSVAYTWSGTEIGSNVPFGAAFREDGTDNYILSFRGTADAVEWIIDLHFAEELFRPYAASASDISADITIELGFYSLYKTMRDAIFAFLRSTKVSRLVFSGHSLGAALAALCALDYMLSQEVMDLRNDQQIGIFAGTPRVITPPTHSLYMQHLRKRRAISINISNINDLVTQEPGDDYVLMPDLFPLNFLPNEGLHDRHRLENYLRAFDEATR